MAQPNLAQQNRQSRAPPNQQSQKNKKRRQRGGPPPSQQALISKISAVQIEGLVLLKIIKHCGDYLPQRQAVSGKLLGLPTNQHIVEVTNCFPVPTTQFTESDEANENEKKRANIKATQYSQDMIRLMSRIREDNLTVGFYRSALNGAFLSSQTIDAQYCHQLQSSSSVCIIYDPTASIKGRLVVRAFRLTDSFMKFYSEKNFGPKSVAKYNLSSDQIFEELDVKIKNSHLVHAFLYEIAQLTPDKSLINGYDRLHHCHDQGIVTNLRQLSSSIDGYAKETQEFRGYYSKSLKNKNKKEDYLTSFKAENDRLKSQGRKIRPLPDVDKLYPPPEEPQRIESVTLTAQMNEYCEEVETSIMQGLVKLWVTQGIQSNNIVQ